MTTLDRPHGEDAAKLSVPNHVAAPPSRRALRPLLRMRAERVTQFPLPSQAGDHRGIADVFTEMNLCRPRCVALRSSDFFRVTGSRSLMICGLRWVCCCTASTATVRRCRS